jgi:4-hydroxybenzoate polyprenyltransferase
LGRGPIPRSVDALAWFGHFVGTSMSSKARAWFDLTRIYNVPIPLGGMLVGAYCVDSTPGFTNWVLLVISAIVGCTATQAFNDYEDREGDAKNAAFRPLPAGRLQPAAVLWGGRLLTLAWAGLAALVDIRAALIVAAIHALTRHYSRIKRHSLIHHLMLPAALGLLPAYGALMVGHGVPSLALLAGASIMLIDVNMNIVGAFKDLWAGSVRERVLPTVIGTRRAVEVALVLGVVGIAIQALAAISGLCELAALIPLGLGLALTLHSRLALRRRPCAAVGYAALQSGRLTECLTFPALLAGLIPMWQAAAIIVALTIFALGAQRWLPEAQLPPEAHDFIA